MLRRLGLFSLALPAWNSRLLLRSTSQEVGESKSQGSCSADRWVCGLRLLRAEGHVSRRANAISVCYTGRTRTTNSVVCATLAQNSTEQSENVYENKGQGQKACSADRRVCGLRLLRTEGHVSRRANATSVCGTGRTWTTDSVVRATLAQNSREQSENVYENKGQGQKACGADRWVCGLRLLRAEGHVSRRANEISVCGTGRTRTTNSVVRATLADLASFRTVSSGSASFHSARKSWYLLRAFALSPERTSARATPNHRQRAGHMTPSAGSTAQKAI